MVRRRVQRAERVRTRRQLGPLGNRRVAPSTNKLYDAALQLFSAWLRAEGKRLPRHEDHMPPLLERFAETLWQEGETKADLANLLSALELAEARLKAVTRSAWRLYGVWKKDEMVQRCTPMKRRWLKALIGLALSKGWDKTAFVLAVMDDCLLRTVEGATLRMGNFKVKGSSGLLILSASKGQTRTGGQESLTLQDSRLVKWAAALKVLEQPGDSLIPGGSCMLRRSFRQLVKEAGLQNLDLQVYSIRRGAATNLFRRCASFDTVSDRGRWKNIRTCRIYVDAALQDAAGLEEEAGESLKAGLRCLTAFFAGL